MQQYIKKNRYDYKSPTLEYIEYNHCVALLLLMLYNLPILDELPKDKYAK